MSQSQSLTTQKKIMYSVIGVVVLLIVVVIPVIIISRLNHRFENAEAFSDVKTSIQESKDPNIGILDLQVDQLKDERSKLADIDCEVLNDEDVEACKDIKEIIPRVISNSEEYFKLQQEREEIQTSSDDFYQELLANSLKQEQLIEQNKEDVSRLNTLTKQ